MQVYRGDIFFVAKRENNNMSSEQDAGRPAVIVSNEKCNEHSNVVEVVYLTSVDKKPLPTHVSVMGRIPSTALCEQIHSVSKDRLLEYVRSCTDAEMDDIDRALMISLGIDTLEKKDVEVVETAKSDNSDLLKVEAERDIYKRLYEQMIDRMMGGR